MSVNVKCVFEAADAATGEVTGRITFEGFGLSKAERNGVNQEALNFMQRMLDASDKE